jgi:hypothetical protein
MSDNLSDECLGVMKFGAASCLAQLAAYGALGGEQFYATMREGVDSDVDKAKTEKIIGALKAIAEVMGDGLAEAIVEAAR